MSHTRTAILLLRILLFTVLGALFIHYGLGMELASAKALFVGIGIADFAYAFVLAKPFWQHKPTQEN